MCATSLFGTMAARHSSNLPVRIDQLIDLPSGRPATDSAFGLLRQDYSAKPAYSALRNLLHLLSDPGPPFVGQELGFELAGDLSDLHHLLLQKRNGVFYLILWLEKPSYDVANKEVTPVPARSIAVQNTGVVRMTLRPFDKAGATGKSQCLKPASIMKSK